MKTKLHNIGSGILASSVVISVVAYHHLLIFNTATSLIITFISLTMSFIILSVSIIHERKERNVSSDINE